MDREAVRRQFQAAIVKIVTPLIETGEGISDAPLFQFALEESEYFVEILAAQMKIGTLKEKQQ